MSAVRYLIEQLFPKALSAEQYYHIEQALQMEEDNIIKAFNEGTFATDEKVTAEQYYSENFKNK